MTTTTTTAPWYDLDAEMCTGSFEDGFAAGWTAHADYARQAGLSFEAGVEFGFSAASRAVANAIAEAVDSMPYEAQEIVHRLVRLPERRDDARERT